MADESAASATGMVTASRVMTSSPMVVATATPNRNGPAKFVNADIVNALRGDMAREAIAVATTFALSWKPLRKSNVKATATKNTSQIFTGHPLCMGCEPWHYTTGGCFIVAGIPSPSSRHSVGAIWSWEMT